MDSFVRDYGDRVGRDGRDVRAAAGETELRLRCARRDATRRDYDAGRRDDDARAIEGRGRAVEGGISTARERRRAGRARDAGDGDRAIGERGD